MTKLLVRGRGSGDVVMTVVGVTSVPHVVIIVAVVVVGAEASAATVAATAAGSGVALGPAAADMASCIDVDDAGATVCIGGLLMSPFRSSSSAIFKFWS